jgi:hypothetical protein
MTMHLQMAWDFAKIGSATWEIEEDTSGKTLTFTMATGAYAHIDGGGSTGLVTNNAIYFPNLNTDAAVGTAFIMRWLAILNADLTGVYSLTAYDSCRYTIGCVGDTFRFTSNTTTLARRILGITTVGGAFANAFTSEFTPYYSIVATRGAWSNVSDDYEPDGQAENAECDDGTVYGIGRTTYATYFDFTAPMEPKEIVRKRDAEATAPWTYQHAWQHIRNEYEFVTLIDPVYDGIALDAGTKATLHRLRKDGAAWRPARVSADYDDLWDINFRTHLIDRWTPT